MNKTAVVKFAARAFVGVGTTTVSNSIIANNVEPTNLIQKISVPVAAFVIGAMASDATKSYTDAEIDKLAAAFKNLKSQSTDPAPTV